jgi:hypothetical protein
MRRGKREKTLIICWKDGRGRVMVAGLSMGQSNGVVSEMDGRKDKVCDDII